MRHVWSSVRARATVGATGIVAVALLVGTWFLVTEQERSLTRSVETTIELRVEDLTAAIRETELPARLTIDDEEETFIQIVDAGQVILSSANIDGEPPIVSADTGSEVRFRTIGTNPVDDTDFRVASATVEGPDGPIGVIVGQSLEPVSDGVEALVRSLLLGLPLLIGLVAVVTWAVVGRALRPVERMRREVEAIEASNLDQRIAPTGSHDEVARLAMTMNAMLDRLSDAARKQRRFVTDASHELRSPLTGMRAQLEVALAHPDVTDWPTTSNDVLADTMRLQRLADDLLAAARSDDPDGTFSPRLTDLDDIVLREVRRVRLRGSVEVDATKVEAVQSAVDPDGLTRIVRNLLDNAERHARSRIDVMLTTDDRSVRMQVKDDGPGIPSAQRDAVFERFARLDQARDRDAGGSGLGLAIARQIATQHGGTLIVLDSASGALLELTLPLA